VCYLDASSSEAVLHDGGVRLDASVLHQSGNPASKVAGTAGPDVVTVYFDNSCAGANPYERTGTSPGCTLYRGDDGTGNTTACSLFFAKAAGPG
jgi:hypothetical protein